LYVWKVRDTIIGDEKVRGVSGGERKRANIGMQLIVDPAVLFLDEPTSGLDSFQAQAVMESMKYMARSGRLVVTVIHQPRSSIFDMFDQLLLLSEGRTIYLGIHCCTIYLSIYLLLISCRVDALPYFASMIISPNHSLIVSLYHSLYYSLYH
jgi:energy-coupling factor transporter ATP-binding protein EcfA2